MVSSKMSPRHHSPHCGTSSPGPVGSQIPIPLQEEVIEACKLQRHYPQHCLTKVKVCAG